MRVNVENAEEKLERFLKATTSTDTLRCLYAPLNGHDLKILQEINGMRVLDKIIELDPDACDIMFSGHDSKQNIAQAERIGAKGFITKPFNQERDHYYIDECSSLMRKFGKKQTMLTSPLLSISPYRHTGHTRFC